MDYNILLYKDFRAAHPVDSVSFPRQIPVLYGVENVFRLNLLE